jgi:hypothetical protein
VYAPRASAPLTFQRPTTLLGEAELPELPLPELPLVPPELAPSLPGAVPPLLLLPVSGSA